MSNRILNIIIVLFCVLASVALFVGYRSDQVRRHAQEVSRQATVDRIDRHIAELKKRAKFMELVEEERARLSREDPEARAVFERLRRRVRERVGEERP